MIPSASPPRWLGIVALGLLLGFGFLGTRGLWEPDEGRYVEAAREMLISGNWLVPCVDHHPHLTKPPLTYWMVAAGLKLLGPDEWGARGFLGGVYLATVLLISALGARMWGSPAGRWAGVVHGTMFLPFVAASVVVTDALLALWETAALASFWMAWAAVDRRVSHRWLLAMWACLGLAFLTKGPPALLPLVVTGLFLVLLSPEHRRPGLVRALFHPAGILLFCAVGLGWFAWVSWANTGLARYFVVDEVIARNFSAAFRRNPQWYRPFQIYLPAILIGTLPWSVTWPRLGWRSRRRWSWRTLRGHPRGLLLALWVAVPLVMFSLSSSRLVLYVLPVFPALALLTTGGLLREGRGRAPAHPGRSRALVGVWIVLLLAVRLGAAYYPTERDSRRLAGFVREYFDPATSELVVVDRNVHALGFYLGGVVEIVHIGKSGFPSYWPNETLGEEIAQLGSATYRHLFLVYPPQLGGVLERVRTTGAVHRVIPGPGVSLVVCEPAEPQRNVHRLAIAWLGPEDGRSRFEIADRLEDLHEIRKLDAILAVERSGPGIGAAGRLAAPLPGILWPLVQTAVPVTVVEESPGDLGEHLSLGTGRFRILVAPGLRVVSAAEGHPDHVAPRPWRVALLGSGPRPAPEPDATADLVLRLGSSGRGPARDGSPRDDVVSLGDDGPSCGIVLLECTADTCRIERIEDADSADEIGRVSRKAPSA